LNHYFTKNVDLESDEKSIYFKIKDKEFHFITDNGVFSKSRLDFGSRILIESTIDINSLNTLDLGCGYGPIGIVYKTYNKNTYLTMIDINDRAVELAKKNAELNFIKSEVINKDINDIEDNSFSLILSNPPIRSGKEKLYKIIENAKRVLVDNGMLIFVIHKQLGALSAKRFCEGIYKKVEVLNRKSGYFIIKCIK